MQDILAGFLNEDSEFKVDGDEFLHNTIETAMKTMNYEELATVVQETSTYEDFNHDKYSNFRATDFDRKWNHTRAKVQTVSMNEVESEAVTSDDVFNEVYANITIEKFWDTINDNDKKLLRLRMDGLTQKEISEKLGYSNHSAVTKRLKNLKEIFMNCA